MGRSADGTTCTKKPWGLGNDESVRPAKKQGGAPAKDKLSSGFYDVDDLSVYMCLSLCGWQRMCVEIRGQPMKISGLLLPRRAGD